MQKQFSDLYHRLIENCIPGIPKFSNQVHPFYAGLSIANIPASVCCWLGCPSPVENALDVSVLRQLDQDYQHVILVLVDGLSLRLFQRFYEDTVENGLHREWQGIFRDGLFLPLTSIAPSTTSAALTTLWTARFPAEHGIIGYELFLKEYGFIANMITHSVSAFINEPVDMKKAGFEPSACLPIETMGQYLATQGIITSAYQHQSISVSGLSQMLLSGTDRFSYNSLDDLWSLLLQTLQRSRNQKSYSYVYWSGLDTFSHHAGPDSQLLYQEWLNFAAVLNHFIARHQTEKNQRTLLLVTADHGQIATNIQTKYDLHNHPGLTHHLVMMPTGESRLPFLFTKPGALAAVQDYLNAHWQGQFSLLPSQSALDCGLLGNSPAHQTTQDRIGDQVVFPKDNAYWWWVKKENHLLGRHGGLSAEEMLVPFFALPL